MRRCSKPMCELFWQRKPFFSCQNYARYFLLWHSYLFYTTLYFLVYPCFTEFCESHASTPLRCFYRRHNLSYRLFRCTWVHTRTSKDTLIFLTISRVLYAEVFVLQLVYATSLSLARRSKRILFL